MMRIYAIVKHIGDGKETEFEVKEENVEHRCVEQN